MSSVIGGPAPPYFSVHCITLHDAFHFSYALKNGCILWVVKEYSDCCKQSTISEAYTRGTYINSFFQVIDGSFIRLGTFLLFKLLVSVFSSLIPRVINSALAAFGWQFRTRFLDVLSQDHPAF